MLKLKRSQVPVEYSPKRRVVVQLFRSKCFCDGNFLRAGKFPERCRLLTVANGECET